MLAWINLSTIFFKAKERSTLWPGAPWWKAQERSALYHVDNLSGTEGGALVWTKFFSSKAVSNSSYFMGIRSNCVLWIWFYGLNYWEACCRGCCMHSLGSGLTCTFGSKSSKDMILSSISFWTSIFKEKSCSTLWPGAPWWKSQERSGLHRFGNLLGTRGSALVWTRLSLSKEGRSSTYFIGIGSYCGDFWAWFCGLNCWGAYCRGYCMHSGWHCCWSLCWNCGGSFITASEDTMLVHFYTSSLSVITSSRSSRTSCSSWSIFCVCTSVCMCELNLK